MKTLLATLALAMSATSLSAQNYLVFENHDNSAKSLSIDGLKITFDNNNAIATVGGKTETFPLNDLKRLYFSDQDITAIEQVYTKDSEVSIEVENGRLKVNAPEGSHIAVYALDGRRINGEYLPQGAYVVRVNDQSFKIAVK